MTKQDTLDAREKISSINPGENKVCNDECIWVGIPNQVVPLDIEWKKQPQIPQIFTD